MLKKTHRLIGILAAGALLLSACTPATAPGAVAGQNPAQKTQVSSAPGGPPPAGAPGAPGSGNPPPGGAQANGTPAPGNPPPDGGAPGNGNPPPGGPPPDGVPGNGTPPPGNPPSGSPGNGNPPPDGAQPPPGGDSSAAPDSIHGAYTLNAETASQSGQTYQASDTDESAIYVTNGGSLTLANATILTSGDSSSSDASSFYGLNAAVLAAAGSTIRITDSKIVTSGAGANGVFAAGSGSNITLENVTIDATGKYAHAVMATLGGVLTLKNVNMTTAGSNSGAIATDRGSGTITATGGTVTTTGADSPGIYSTGVITVSGAKISASGAEAAVIEGANSITLLDSDLSSSKENKWGVMIYQSMSGDAVGAEGSFTMTGGSLAYTAAKGPLFYVTNSTGVITLKKVNLSAASGTLLRAEAGRWGKSGANGGTVILTADGQTLVGDLFADQLSAITATLQNGSVLTGAINPEHTAQAASLTLDASSHWNVTSDSYLTCLVDEAGVSGTQITNITGNGHVVTYDANACQALAGQTYTLGNGGTLQPAK